MSGTGIDISTGLSILVELDQDGAKYRLGRTAILPGLDHQPDQPASRAASGEFAQALETVPGALKRRSAAVSLPGRHVMFRATETGADNPGAIRALVNLEVAELTGNAAGMMPAWQKIESPDGTPMVLVGVTREALVEHYASSLRAAGFSARSFVPAPIALYECFLMSGNLDAPGLQLVANVGENSTDVVLVQNGGLLAARTLTAGVDLFLGRMVSDLGINAEQARETLFGRINIKPGVAADNVGGERAVSAAQDAAAQLFMQLNGVVAQARGQLKAPSLEAAQVVLCGSGAAIQGLREFLKHRFRKPVELLDPLRGVDTGGLDDNSRAAIAPFTAALAVPLGLAKLNADANGRNVEFVAPSSIARANFVKRSVWLYAAVLVVAVSLTLSLWFTTAYMSASASLKKKAESDTAGYIGYHSKLQVKGTATGKASDRIKNLSETNRELIIAEQKLVEAANARKPGIDTQRLLVELPRLMPKEMTLRKFSLEQLKPETNRKGPCIIIESFIESAARTGADVEAEFNAALKRHQVCADIIPEKMDQMADGSGYTARVTVVLKHAQTLLTEAGGQ